MTWFAQSLNFQVEFCHGVIQDPASGNWWLQFNDEIVGYWPRSLFNSLKNAADAIDWGGEIIWDGGTNTSIFTDMGSGEPAALGYERAAYQRNLQYVGIDNALHDVTDLQVKTLFFFSLHKRNLFVSLTTLMIFQNMTIH